MNHYLLFTAEGNETARHFCRQVVEMDPKFDMARVLLGWALQVGARYGFIGDPEAVVSLLKRLDQPKAEKDLGKWRDYRKGKLYQSLNKLDEACVEFQKSIDTRNNPKLKTNYTAACLNEMIKCRFAQDKMKEVEKLEKLLEAAKIQTVR